MAFENFPYTNFHEINLDWILERVKEAYSASNPPDYPVKSVNGMTGDVIIAIPSALVRTVNGESGDVILYRNPLVQFPTTDESRWNLFRICDGDSGDARGIEFDEDGAHRIEGTRRILIYDEENQPDYPVTSVNGQTGDVRITAGVNSVNGKTGNVVTPFVNPNSDILKLDSNSNTILWGISRDIPGGNTALYISTGAGNPQAFIKYTPTEGEPIVLPLLSSADIPSEAGVVSVNGKEGAVTLYGTDIYTDSNATNTITGMITAETQERTAVQTNIEKEIDDIKDTVYEKINGSELEWAVGSINPIYGTLVNSNNFIRCTDISVNYLLIESTLDNLYLSLLAYDSDSENRYMGVYNPADDTFVVRSEYPTTSSINIHRLHEKYPTYNFKMVARYEPRANITVDAASNIIIYTTTESGLQEIITLHTEQISTLQENDITQDQQISALQTSDTTQTQQISALQNADTGYNQQISALQTSQATQDQQISALQTIQATQDQQITELYTRTGVYVVSISNANTLPLRYPATGTDSKIKDTNKVVSMDLDYPGAQLSDWTITTYDGYLEITGTIGGQTNITLYLA